MSEPRPGDTVVIAMSGGVDSSVAAALLVEEGYRVIGVSMRLWGEASDSGCCSLDDFLDARRVAAKLGIPFYVLDFGDEFRRNVVDPFVEEYLRGRTPSPCVRCNQFVKFASFWDRARELGADWVATGHYARIVRTDGRAQLWAGADPGKDQSYFLFSIQPQVLERMLLPVGGMSKPEVRARAHELGLITAAKPESQEICFAPKGEYAAFVERYSGVRAASGSIVDQDGRTLGAHEGIHHFTIGQRRGLGVSAAEPLYVTGIEPQSGTVQVGPRSAILSYGVVAGAVNWLGDPPVAGMSVQVKIRSRFAPTPVRLETVAADGFVVRSESGLAAVTPGQAAVLYDGDRILGGGWIERGLAAEG